MTRASRREATLGWALVAPMLTVLGIVAAYPFGYAVWMSLHDKVIGYPDPHFIWFQNYVDILGDPQYWESARLSAAFTIPGVAIKLVLGLGVALLFNQQFRARGIIRGISMIPWALPLIVVVAAWRFILDDTDGVLNDFLLETGLVTAPVGWLANTDTALPAILAVSIWRSVPFVAITLLAGLQSIPDSLYEAASVDGAGALRKLWAITLPHLTPVAMVVALLVTIWTLNEFSLIWTMTRGGPADATNVLPVLTYRTAVISGELGRGVAISVTLVPILILLLMLLRRVNQKAESER